ncbi:MAG: SMI1/KNR4 family protein [Treponema sp.]|nr:SMI1/KNR4 family protein [Treponema sp.]
MERLTWKYVKELKNKYAIEDFEKAYDIVLPLDLKQCIKENNGGRPGKKLFDTDKTKERVFKTLLSFNESDIENIYTFFPIIQAESSSLVPFASDPSGNFICVKDTRIVLFLHETGAIEHIAESFTELLSRLYE